MKMDWKEILKATSIGFLILLIAFMSWYYFAIKIPQQKEIEENREKTERIKEYMEKAGYTQKEIEDIDSQ